MGKIKGYVFLAFTILMFSTFEVVSYPLKAFMGPLQLTFLRFIIGGLSLLPFVLLNRNENKLKRKDYFYFAVLGALNVGVSMGCMQAAIFFGKASTAAVIVSSNPIFVMMFSIFLLKEKLEKNRLIAILFGLVGLIFIASRYNSGGDSFAGVFLAILGTVVFALYTVLSKMKSENVSSIAMISYSSIFGSLVYIPYFIVSGINPINIPSETIIRLLFLGVIVSGLAYYTYIEALKILGAGKGSMVFFLKPAIAIILAAIFLGEIIKINTIVGSLLILVGMFINFFVRRRNE